MKMLTDGIRQQIRSGWKVAVERDDMLMVYDVVARDNDDIVGKERWILYPKDSGKAPKEVNTSLPKLTELNQAELEALKEKQTTFSLIAPRDIVSCLSNADGYIYSNRDVWERYGHYDGEE